MDMAVDEVVDDMKRGRVDLGSMSYDVVIHGDGTSLSIRRPPPPPAPRACTCDVCPCPCPEPVAASWTLGVADSMIKVNHELIPHAVFGHPQVASVGMTERQAAEAGISYKAHIQQYGSAAYGWAMEDTTSITANRGRPMRWMAQSSAASRSAASRALLSTGS